MKDRFLLALVCPDASLFEGEVRSVQIPTSEGLIGIYPGHAPLLSLLGPGVLSLEDTNGERRQFVIRDGFLEVLPRKVTVLAGQAEPIGALAAGQARTALDELGKRRAHGDVAIDSRLEEQAYQRVRLKAAESSGQN